MSKTIDDALGNLRRLERLLANSPYDAVIAVLPDNVRYVGDVLRQLLRRLEERPVAPATFADWLKQIDAWRPRIIAAGAIEK